MRAAARGLDPVRRTIAAYGIYYADSLGTPQKAAPVPTGADSVYAAVASAYVTAFLDGIPAAIAKVRDAERRWPDDPFLPAVRSQLAMLTADRIQMKEAFERSLALDPNEPTGLQARANYRSDYEADYAGALADIQTAIAAQPGSPALWNALALIHDDRDAMREAQAAIETSIALDPQDPLGHANRALLLLEQNRLDEAKAEIDTALALDPSFDVARVALGRWHLQRGEMGAAVTELLAASTANPTYSNALLLLAAAYYQSGTMDPAKQALDNADRLDPNDPVASIVRSRIAIDDYEADVAIAAAREALARSKRRGGFYKRLGENDDASSMLADALRFAGLDAWARYHGDRAFKPFDLSGYSDSSAAGNSNPFADALAFGVTKPDPDRQRRLLAAAPGVAVRSAGDRVHHAPQPAVAGAVHRHRTRRRRGRRRRSGLRGRRDGQRLFQRAGALQPLRQRQPLRHRRRPQRGRRQGAAGYGDPRHAGRALRSAHRLRRRGERDHVLAGHPDDADAAEPRQALGRAHRGDLEPHLRLAQRRQRRRHRLRHHRDRRSHHSAGPGDARDRRPSRRAILAGRSQTT